MPEIVVFLLALAITIRGASWFGRSAIIWGRNLGLPYFVIGAVFVSAVTALPEITFAIISGSVNNEPRFALGAVLGSALINSGLLLGLFFLFFKQRPLLGYFSRSVYIFVVISLLLLVVSLNSYFGGLVSVLLLILGGLFILLEFIIGTKSQTFLEKVESRFEEAISFFSFSKNKAPILEFVLGILFLLIGTSFMVNSALSIANLLQLDELYVSFTLVAFGTSLPELIVIINSFKKGQVALLTGNLVGSSVINLTIGVGVATFIHGTTIALPNNLIIFIPLILIGLLALTSLWKKLSLNLIGSLLLGVTILCLVIFSIQEIF